MPASPWLYVMRTPSFNATGRAVLVLILLAAGDAARSLADEASHAKDAVDRTTQAPMAATRVAPSASARGPVQIVVYKSTRTLALYRSGDFEKEFPVVLGLQPDGRKRHSDDARTPEGLYHVVGKRRHPRWQWFLAIDYPNPDDRRAYNAAVRAGRIPDEDGAPFSIGGSVGIHGNDRLQVQASGLDWTKGCVAMMAEDIAELAAKAPVGTPVWIVE